MTTAWVIKSAITDDDIYFMDSCGISSEVKEFGRHPKKETTEPLRWWQIEHDDSARVTHTMRIFFHAKDDKEVLLLQLRYGDQLMPASEHWTRNIPGTVVDL